MSQGAYFEGTEMSLCYVQCFLCLVSSPTKSLFFIVHGWILSGPTAVCISL